MDQITECIKNGFKNAYMQFKKLNVDEYEFQNKITEYYFTVNVVQELLKKEILNIIPNSSIHLEYDAYNFINNAFDKIIWKPKNKDMFDSKILKRQAHSTCRQGRIDIAILKEIPRNIFNNRSIYGIEIKSLIRNINEINQDIQRLTEAILETDPISENSIEKCFVGFAFKLHTKKKLFTVIDFKREKRKVLKEINLFLSSNYDSEYLYFDVYDNLLEIRTAEQEAASIPNDFWDSNEIAINSGAILGIIIEIQKNNNKKLK